MPLFQLVMIHHKFSNGEVEFIVSLPWRIDSSNPSYQDSLDYLCNEFSISPDTCVDSTSEEWMF